MLVMAINLSIGYICTYIPIDLSINRLARTTTTLYSYIEFFLPLLLCVYIILICLATIGIHTSIYVCMHTANVANQERIPSIMEFPCNVYRVSLCVHSVCVLFSLLAPLIYQCFGAIYEMLALCLSTNLHFYSAQHITPHHLSIWRAKTSTWAVGWKKNFHLVYEMREREVFSARAIERCEKVWNLLCYINYDHRYISSLTYYILCVFPLLVYRLVSQRTWICIICCVGAGARFVYFPIEFRQNDSRVMLIKKQQHTHSLSVWFGSFFSIHIRTSAWFPCMFAIHTAPLSFIHIVWFELAYFFMRLVNFSFFRPRQVDPEYSGLAANIDSDINLAVAIMK